MLRKVLLVFGLCFFVCLSARAQEERAEVFGGYSYMRFRSAPSVNLNGWEAAGEYKFTEWLGGVADFGGSYGSPSGVSTSTYTYLFGPQISYPSRVSPFAHLLLGGAHIGAGGFGNSSFSMALGGGIDTTVGRGLRWRVLQADYLLTQFGGGSQNNLRLSTGLIFRF